MSQAGEQETGTESKKTPWWASTTFAAGLTAVCTVLVAYSSFRSAEAASNSADLYAQSAIDVSLANFYLEQGSDALLEDLPDDLTRLCLVEVQLEPQDPLCTDEELTTAEDFLLSDDAILLGLDLNDAGEAAYAEGLAESKKSVDLQASLVLFAIGLALSAWAALSDTATRARIVFEVLAIVSVVVGLAQLVSV
ncbi:MAG: hypothetical protein ACR2O6_05735 [Ilumatobacteraceae bacterium]